MQTDAAMKTFNAFARRGCSFDKYKKLGARCGVFFLFFFVLEKILREKKL